MNDFKADAYSSEEARLAAQRAMTERFGLKVEDEEEDEGDGEEGEGEEGEEKEEERVEGKEECFEEDEEQGKEQAKEDKEEEGIGKVKEVGEEKKEEGGSDGKQRGSVREERAVLKEEMREKGHEEIGKEEENERGKLEVGDQGRRPVVLIGGASPRKPGWPGVEIGADRKVMRNGAYNAREDKKLQERRLRVTPVTKYSSMYGRGQGRRIAAGKHVVCYAVGGHVRVIARHVGDRALLKGHGASVVDMELLGEAEQREGGGDRNEKGWMVIVASVAEDGWAIIWKVRGPAIRFGAGGELKVEKVARIGYGPAWGYYSAVKWERSGQEDVKLTGWRTMALLDAQKKFVRLVSVEVDTGKIGATTQIGEEGDVFTSIEWIAENCLVVAGGRAVKIWDAGARKMCLAHDVGADVLALHSMGTGCFEGRRLLVSVNSGRSLLVLGLTFSLENMRIRCKITPIQTIKLKDTTEDAYMSISVVPGSEFFVMTDISSQLLYAAHFNVLAGAIDTLTAMPLSSPALSACATMGSSSHVAENQITGARRAEERLEISVWAIQPKAINLIHLPANFLLPHVPMISLAAEAATSPADPHRKARSSAPDNSQPTRKTAPVVTQKIGIPSDAKSASKSDTPGHAPIVPVSPAVKDSEMKAVTSSSPSVLHSPIANPSATNGSSTAGAVDKSATVEKIFSPGPPMPINWTEFKQLVQKGGSAGKSPVSAAVSSEEDEKKQKEKKETRNNGPSTTSDTRKKNRELDPSISAPPDSQSLFIFQGKTPESPKSATKDVGPRKATDTKEAAAGASASKNEAAPVEVAEHVVRPMEHKRKPKQPKDPGVEILRAVEATVAKFEARGREQDEKEKRRIGRLRDTVRASTKDILKKAVDNSMGRTLTNALNAGWNNPEITTGLFTAAIRDARLADGFGKASTEMRMQLISAVSAGMEKKYETILAPVLDDAKAATADLETTSRSLKSFRPGVCGSVERTDPQQKVAETIEKLLEKGDSEGALTAALRTGESNVFLDVCKKIDPHELFAEHKPSQLLVISITEQLGIGLNYEDDDRDLKLVWLDEALLAADISSDSSGRDELLEVLQQLGEAIAAIRAEAMKNKDAGVRRKATMLGHVIKSIGSNLRR